MSMGAEFLVGATSGVAASEASRLLHQEQEDLKLLSNIHSTLKNIEGFFAEQVSTKDDEHKTLNLFNPPQWTALYFGLRNQPPFLTLHLLVPVASTLNVRMSGMPDFQLVFAAAPTAGQYALGQYYRWRFPEGTMLSLNTPNQAGIAFPIDLLYSDELGD